MSSLTKEDLIKILTEPETSLIKQYIALLATENVKLTFNKDSIAEIAYHASNFNIEIEDIGARRLHTILEHLLEDISFRASDMKEKKIVIDKDFVTKGLEGLVKNRDLAKFIL
jgi:ATP-dependent HslUV protease ATP-binding subunit HslU